MKYTSINSKKPSKLRRLLIVLAVLAVLALVFLWVVGAIAGSDSAENQNISAAVAENVQLKQQVAELQQQITDLQAQIDGLNGELAARPTIEPTPYAPVGAAAADGAAEPVPTETVVPR